MSLLFFKSTPKISSHTQFMPSCHALSATFHFPSFRPFHCQPAIYASQPTQWPTCKPATISVNGSPPAPKNYEIALEIVENICVFVRGSLFWFRFPDKDGPMNLSPGKGNTHLEKTAIYQWNFEVDFDPYLIFFFFCCNQYPWLSFANFWCFLALYEVSLIYFCPGRVLG